MVSVAVAGQLGGAALATQAYALQVTQVAMLTAVALSLAVEISVGRLIGAAALHQAHALARRALGLGLLLALLLAGSAAL